MRSLFLSVVFAALAAGLLDPWASFLPDSREPSLVLVETAGPATPLDAALILRAILRYQPLSIAFLDPLAGEEGAALLQSRLEDAAVPVTFSPAEGDPSRIVVPPARMSFDHLMIRTERSERGELTTALDAFFRGREVVVEAEGETGWSTLAKPVGSAPPIEQPFALAAVLLAAVLPWVRLPRGARARLALALGSFWLLLALTGHSVAPIALVYAFVLLPILGWLVPAPGERPT